MNQDPQAAEIAKLEYGNLEFLAKTGSGGCPLQHVHFDSSVNNFPEICTSNIEPSNDLSDTINLHKCISMKDYVIRQMNICVCELQAQAMDRLSQTSVQENWTVRILDQLKSLQKLQLTMQELNKKLALNEVLAPKLMAVMNHLSALHTKYNVFMV